MDFGLVNYQELMRKQYQAIVNLVKPYENKVPAIKSEIANIDNIYKAKLVDFKPQIMFFGIYNAGKSSILNEMIKEDLAEVNDKPTTDKVDYYDWNGYTIADTPGVGAPIEHQNVTMEHLKKADVVLFVISTNGSHDKAENYTRMKDIVEAGKKVIVVLNDKDGDLGKNDEIIDEIKRKVYENIRQVGIHEHCHIVVVNAKRARKGRLENKPNMLKKSNFAELEMVVKNELKHTNSFVIIKNAIIEIEKSLNSIIESLQIGAESSEIKGLQKVLAAIHEQKNIMKQNMKEYIVSKTSRLGKTLPDIIWAVRENQAQADNAVDAECKKVIDSVEKEFECQMQDFEDNLQLELQNFVDAMGKINIDGSVGTNLNAKCDSSLQGNANFNINSKQAKELVGVAQKIMDLMKIGKGLEIPDYRKYADEKAKGNIVAQIASSKAGQTVAKEVIKQAVSYGLISKGVASTLGKAIPYVGPVLVAIDVISSLLGGGDDRSSMQAEADAANQQAQAKVVAEMQARQSLQQNCQYMAEDLAEQLQRSIYQNINEIVGNIEKEFNSKIQDSKGDEKNRAEILASLHEIINNFDNLKQELTSIA